MGHLPDGANRAAMFGHESETSSSLPSREGRAGLSALTILSARKSWRGRHIAGSGWARPGLMNIRSGSAWVFCVPPRTQVTDKRGTPILARCLDDRRVDIGWSCRRNDTRTSPTGLFGICSVRFR